MQKINTLSRKDKWKLIYACLIYPILLMSSIGGHILSELYSKYGNAGYNASLQLSNKIAAWLSTLFYIPLIFPAIIIRFVYFRRGLNYGIEIYSSMIISILISKLIIFLLHISTLIFFHLGFWT